MEFSVNGGLISDGGPTFSLNARLCVSSHIFVSSCGENGVRYFYVLRCGETGSYIKGNLSLTPRVQREKDDFLLKEVKLLI